MKRFLLLSATIVAFLVTSAVAQERTVSGKVVAEESGSPIPGVNVILKGTTIGTVTDIDGNYKLNVPAEGGTLVFSFIGLATEEVRIGSQSVIDMVMTADIKQLTEVVVTAVGIEAERASLGYSIQSVGSEEIDDSLEPNLLNALNQKAAGVFVYSSAGSPGASSNIRIRGNTSVSLGNSPLFVVDGVPIDNSGGTPAAGGTAGVDVSNRAIDVNPNDVESITVLKGPAATVLYGIRAANGAIIITTKKGQAGAPEITFNSNYAASQVNKLPEMNRAFAQGRPVNGVPTWRGPHFREGFSWGPWISNMEYSTDFDQFANLYFDGDSDAASEYWTPDRSTYLFDDNGFLVPQGQGNGRSAQAYDNNDNFFVTGHSTDNNLSISGGTDDMRYYVSAGYLYQSGVVPQADWSRKTFLGKIDADLTEDFSVGLQANYINSGGYRIQRGSNISGVMLGLMRNTPTFDIAKGYTDGREAADDPDVYILPDGRQRSYRLGIYDSPFWTVNKNPFEDDVNRIIGNVNATWRTTPWLTMSYKLGVDTYHDRRISAFDINSADTPEGQVDQYNGHSMDLNSDFLLLFNYDFSQALNLSATVGHNFYQTSGVTRTATGTTLGATDFYHISNATDIQAFEGIGEKMIHGAFVDAKIGYNNYLFLNLSARNDWSSALPKENNSFFYPAISLAWTFTENFGLSTNPVFSYGKLRASWGQVGNDAPIYATTTPFVSAGIGGDGFIDGIGFPAFGVNSFSRSTSLGNPDLEAELTTTIELGGEFQFFQGRLGFDLTYYSSETEGQVLNVDIAPSTGFNGVIQNAGLIKNTGWEIMANATPLQMGDFNWDMNFNFTQYETTVEELDPSIGEGGIFLAGFVSTSARVITGQPYSVLYGNRYQRVESGPNAGRLLIGSDGWPLADPNAGPIGDPNPDWLLGARNTFSWKGISLSALLDIRQGGDMWNGTRGVMDYWGNSEETAEDRDIKGYVFDGVRNTGTADNPTYEENTIPVDFFDSALGFNENKWVRYGFGFSENEIEDASWVRLRELALSYNFPRSLIGNLGIEDLSIGFIGRNLWLNTNYTGIDPEANLTGTTNGFGLEYFGMPNTKSYAVNLRIGF